MKNKQNKPTKKGNHLKRKTNNLICNLYPMAKPSHKKLSLPDPIPPFYILKMKENSLKTATNNGNWKCLCGLGICCREKGQLETSKSAIQ